VDRKHKLTHDKPFMCDEANCKRGNPGFGTTNDLNRHKKSVHRIGLFDKSYKCASETCRTKEKIWPRLDNFKQHIDRMHKDEDVYDLIKRYNSNACLTKFKLMMADLPSYLSSRELLQKVPL
jgi:hypothetical protein